MKEDHLQPGDEKLNGLLRAGRPVAELPPGFQAAVWRRIEKSDAPSVSLVELLAQWFRTPRLATVAVTVVVMLAAGLGAVRGLHKGDEQARAQYVTSVDPTHLRR